ncbi:uracil-DNA glycosylase family protein [Eupransor demetentiae]|uniref:Uracil-DNA glycosylase (Udg4) n=1 Tax=Eupransor demetentiae TaxID=3109584 RepID=A0ABM9N516_9LACO|nr:Uracil-DNA glycosylase (Udg4) [Lactobacillaceae bacterium LMG 33000]
MSKLILQDEIEADPMNAEFTKEGLKPIYWVDPRAKILIVGQAPGRKVQETGIMWNDASGDRLREWLGVDHDTFYNSGLFAVLPMDCYYPGKAKSGDKPPRKEFAEKWHPKLMAKMPNIQLIILIGSYAQRYYLHLAPKVRTTDVIKDFRHYLPKYLPIVHPSPRNNIWLKRNPWFEKEVIPRLQAEVKDIQKGVTPS